MVIKEVLTDLSGRLKEHGNKNAVMEANMILRHFLKLEPIDLILLKDKELSGIDIENIYSALERRIKHEPLQYILGVQEFMGLEFNVNKNVLVPRADTETLVEYLLNKYMNRGFRALDIGTGSGCIAISLAHFNKNAFVRGIDISEGAIETAKENAEKNNVEERVVFCLADIFKSVIYGQYDIVVSNPPYIESETVKSLDREVRDYEPIGALDGGGDGLKYYRHIVKIAPSMLLKGGMLAFEVGYNQAERVSELMKKDFNDIEIIKDLCGVNRVVAGRIN